MALIFKIGEFSKLTQVSIRMLRYYDETGLLKPACIDPLTGYRLYSVEQLSVVNKITFLRDAGFNVSEIALIITNWSKDHLEMQLQNKKHEIETTIQNEQVKLTKIRYAIENMDYEMKGIDATISLKHIPSYTVLSLRKMIPNYFAEKQLWEELTCFVKKNKVKLTNELNFAMYHDQEYKESDVDVEICATVQSTGENAGDFRYRRTEEVQMMACMMVHGAYENIAGAYFSFAEWLSKHSLYSMTNEANRQICHRGPWNEEHTENYLTEIQIPIKMKA